MKHCCYECNHRGEKDWCGGGERDSEGGMNMGSEKEKNWVRQTLENPTLFSSLGRLDNIFNIW